MTVRFDVAGHVATVTIVRPEVMNAIDLATEAELQRIWSELEQRRDVRVIVLTGDGERAFCVGADMKNPSGSPTPKGVDYWAAARPGGFGGIALRGRIGRHAGDELELHRCACRCGEHGGEPVTMLGQAQ